MNKHMNRKGLELSMTVIVTLIISIIIFIAGIKILNDVFSGAQELERQMSEKTNSEIERLIAEENAVVAIPFKVQQAGIGDSAGFGVGIRNIEAQQKKFTLVLSFENAYDDKGQQLYGNEDHSQHIPTVNKNWLGGKTGFQSYAANIKARSFSIIPLRVKVDPMLYPPSGTTKRGGYYVFDVCIYADPAIPDFDGCSVNWPQEKLSNLYTGKVYQLFVNVN